MSITQIVLLYRVRPNTGHNGNKGCTKNTKHAWRAPTLTPSAKAFGVGRSFGASVSRPGVVRVLRHLPRDLRASVVLFVTCILDHCIGVAQFELDKAGLEWWHVLVLYFSADVHIGQSIWLTTSSATLPPSKWPRPFLACVAMAMSFDLYREEKWIIPSSSSWSLNMLTV